VSTRASAAPALRWQDDPWRRLPWLAALAVLLTLASLMGFLRLLEQQPARSRPRGLVDVQIVELPPSTGAPAPQAAPKPPAPAPARSLPRPKPRPEVKPPPNVAVPRIEPPPPVPSTSSETEPQAQATTESVPAPEPTPSSGAATGSAASQPPASATAALPPGAVSGTGKGVDLGGGRMGARAIFNPLPEIPEALRHRAIEVVAVARFRVAANGIAQVDLIQPTSDPDLNRTLLESLKRWRFFPAMQDGKPVGSTLEIRIPISVR